MARVYQHARVNGTDIHFHLADYTDPWRADSVETFLMYPGYCRNIEFWHAWVPLLARDYRVLRMDPRGYGHSGKPAAGEGVDLDQSIQDALGLMDALGIERVHWVGESTGGKVGMAIALQSPGRIASIT